MNKSGYICLYAATYSILHLLDALTTHVAIATGVGVEINPVLNTRSLLTLIFDPLNIVVLSVGTGIVYYAESNRARTAVLLKSAWISLLGAPYVLLILKLVPILNNTMLHAGIGTPIALLPRIGDSLFLSMIIFSALLAISLQYPAKYVLRLRYHTAAATNAISTR